MHLSTQHLTTQQNTTCNVNLKLRRQIHDRLTVSNSLINLFSKHLGSYNALQIIEIQILSR